MVSVLLIFGAIERDFYKHGSPLSCRTGKRDASTEQRRPFAHAQQANRFGIRNLGLGNATAIVFHFQAELAPFFL
jgi:hypothetical protein